MIAAHILLGVSCGSLAGAYAWFVIEAAFWWVILAYWGAGSAACFVSAGAAMVVAAICPGQREPLPEEL